VFPSHDPAEGVANLQAAVPASIESLKVLTNEVGIETVAGLGAAGIALAGFAAVLTLASNESAKAEKAMESQLNAQRLYYQAIEDGDLESTTSDLASVQSELRAELQNLADIEKQVNRQFGESNNVLQDAGSRIRFFTSELGVNDGRLKELIEQQKVSNDTIAELRDKENALLRARDKLSVVTETLEQAEARRAEASKERAEGFIQYADDVRKLREFELSTLHSTTDANEKLLFQLQKNTDFAREQIEITKSSGENNEATAQAIARYNKEIEQNAAKIEILTAVSLPYTKQLDAQAEAIKQSEEASKALDKS
jgi:type II secretory pathway pseudopilin PulG